MRAAASGESLDSLAAQLQCQPYSVADDRPGQYDMLACHGANQNEGNGTYLYIFPSAGAQTIWLNREVGGNAWYLASGAGWAYRTYDTLASNAVNVDGQLLSGG